MVQGRKYKTISVAVLCPTSREGAELKLGPACRSNKPQSFQLVFHGRIGDRTATVELMILETTAPPWVGANS